MVGRGHGHNVTRKLVDLHEQKRHHPLNFAGLVIVATLLPDGIELVEQKHARDSPHIFEQARQARVRLAEVRPDKCVIADREKLHRQRLGNSLGNRGLTVARRARQQYSMSRLHAVSPKQIGSVLFLDQLSQLLADGKREDQIVESLCRHSLKDRILACLSGRTRRGRRRYRDGIQGALEAVGVAMMALGPFFGNGSFDRCTQRGTITGHAGAHNRKKEIASCHRAHPNPPTENSIYASP